MFSMRRGTRQKVVAGAAVAVLLAGVAVAAVSATGQSNAGTLHAAARARARDLATAATVAAYLGTSPAALSSELSGGKTLAQIADGTAGKSKAGLIDALVAAERRAPLPERAARARLSSEQLARRERRLMQRAQRLMQRNFAAAGAS
jgi:hypothetical protein